MELASCQCVAHFLNLNQLTFQKSKEYDCGAASAHWRPRGDPGEKPLTPESDENFAMGDTLWVIGNQSGGVTATT